MDSGQVQLHAVCAVQSVDGTQQIDRGAGVSASENGRRVLNSEKSPLKRLKKRQNFKQLRVESKHLKNHGLLLQFEMRYSDHP